MPDLNSSEYGPILAPKFAGNGIAAA